MEPYRRRRAGQFRNRAGGPPAIQRVKMGFDWIPNLIAADGQIMNQKASLILGSIIFAIGAWGAVARRNVLIVLISIELMLNAVNLVFASFARMHANVSP